MQPRESSLPSHYMHLSCDLWHKLTKGNCKLDHRGLFSPNRAHKNWLPYKQTFH
ncbi:Uncharacterised protein [Vibrio cholerae]|nr:Uncharacterised protein [Vibrio cholerae]